jgi:hypothetical protein
MDEFEELPSDDLFPDEHELKKENIKLKRQLVKFRDEQSKDTSKLIKQQEKALRNMDEFYQQQLEDLREKNRELFEKNLELHETSKIFVKGLEHLKRDGILVTQTHHWTRRGVNGSLKERINQLVLDGKRIVSSCPTCISPQGDVVEAIIITEHLDKHKKYV